MDTIYYWRGLYGPNAILNSYKPTIDKLIIGDYHGLHIEKLQGKHRTIFSMRVNNTHRLIFTIMMVNGEPCLHMLEAIPNHDYNKARFLKHGVLKRYLSVYGEDIAKDIEANFFSAAEDIHEDNLPKIKHGSTIFYKGVDCYNGITFLLNDDQEQVLAEQLPLIVSGAPGSGKSSTSLSLISQYLDNNQAPLSDIKILYTTSSQRLIDTMSTTWAELCDHCPEKIGAVEFKTCTNALWNKEVQDNIPWFNEDNFKTWWNDRTNKYSKRMQAIDAPPTLSSIYQEFRIIGVYTKEDYLLLGKYQSHIHDKEVKAIVFEAYQSYQRYLTSINCIDPHITPAPNQEQYDLVIVDETQNLSLIQTKNLNQLAKNSQICFCIDSHQLNFAANSLVRAYLLHTITDRHIELQSTYRNPRHVVSIANAILDIKRDIIGGSCDKKAYPKITVHESITEDGQVIWVNPDDKAASRQCIEDVNKAAVAIIAYSEQHDEVKRLFPKAIIIIDPKDAGGLEFKQVLLFKLLEKDRIKAANKALINVNQTKKTSDRSTSFRSKQIVEASMLLEQQQLNILYTCATRAMDTLIIWQKIDHHNRQIVEVLNNAMDTNLLSSSSSSSSSMQPKTIKPATNDDLIKEQEYLIRYRFHKEANDLQKRLHSDATSSKDMPHDELNKLIDEALKLSAPSKKIKQKFNPLLLKKISMRIFLTVKR